MTIEDIARAIAGLGSSMFFYALIGHRDAPLGKSLSDKMTWQEWHDSRPVIDMPRPRSRANKLIALAGIILTVVGVIGVVIYDH